MFSDELINRLKSAKSVTVSTGAGISAESGVPTFRGEDGLWKKYKAEDLANFDAFIRNPQLVWEWYRYRKEIIINVRPNPAHYALVQMESFFPEFALITQNVDNLHRVAGSKNVYELHGNIMRNRCVDCNRYFEESPVDTIPHCECGGLIRPDVVWFGESLPEKKLDLAIQATRRCDIFFSIGTSAQVQPAASLPLEAGRQGAYVVEINYEPTVISQLVDESLIGKAGEILPELIQRLKQS